MQQIINLSTSFNLICDDIINLKTVTVLHGTLSIQFKGIVTNKDAFCMPEFTEFKVELVSIKDSNNLELLPFITFLNKAYFLPLYDAIENKCLEALQNEFSILLDNESYTQQESTTINNLPF